MNYVRPNPLRNLQILWVSLLIAMMLVLSVFWFFFKPSSALQPVGFTTYFILSMILSILAASFGVFRFLLSKARNQTEVQAKTGAYFSAKLVQYAMLEGAAMMAAVSYFMISPDLILLGMAMTVIGLFANLPPTRNRMINELQLTDREAAEVP